MSRNHFAIERGTRVLDNRIIKSRNGSSDFTQFLDMTYNEMKNSDSLPDFIVACMDASNEAFGSKDEATYVTLIDGNGVFIWSVLMVPGDNEDDIKYSLVNWKASDKEYKYVE